MRYRNTRCAKCGKDLDGGGLELVGYGLCCWLCWTEGGNRWTKKTKTKKSK